jgi:hypothetical protein
MKERRTLQEINKRLTHADLVHERMLPYILGDELYKDWMQWYTQDHPKRGFAALYMLYSRDTDAYIQKTIALGEGREYPVGHADMYIGRIDLDYFIEARMPKLMLHSLGQL